jgi:hypothetical protein
MGTYSQTDMAVNEIPQTYSISLRKESGVKIDNNKKKEIEEEGGG